MVKTEQGNDKHEILRDCGCADCRVNNVADREQLARNHRRYNIAQKKQNTVFICEECGEETLVSHKRQIPCRDMSGECFEVCLSCARFALAEKVLAKYPIWDDAR